MDATFEFEYQVLDDDVFLSVEIGDRQLGTSVVKLGDEVICGPGQITKVKVGCGPELTGRKLAIKSLVSDVNEQTNWTSVTYRLCGGAPHSPIVARVQVPHNGDGVVYRTTIKLTSGAAGKGC